MSRVRYASSAMKCASSVGLGNVRLVRARRVRVGQVTAGQCPTGPCGALQFPAALDAPPLTRRGSLSRDRD